MNTRQSLMISGIIGAVLFSIGYSIAVVVPGGGTVSEQDFTGFYGTDDQFFTTLLLLIGLLAGCWAMVWFVTELRSRLPNSILTTVAYSAALIGLGAVAVGGAILFAPIGVQMHSDADFVGVPVAHAFAQAGLTVMLLIGMYSIAFSVGLFSFTLRQANLAPAWFAVGGIVIAVLMVGSFVWAPGFLFPVWVLTLGVVGLRGADSQVAPLVHPPRTPAHDSA